MTERALHMKGRNKLRNRARRLCKGHCGRNVSDASASGYCRDCYHARLVLRDEPQTALGHPKGLANALPRDRVTRIEDQCTVLDLIADALNDNVVAATPPLRQTVLDLRNARQFILRAANGRKP